ncbi:hypothetical protein F2Q68_00010237 [Brassica cretica]|uniref:Uncharacterized protein n=1 Tax=Brassica cretica TaxID=69181 RepID=A0A8S9KTV4_BRACR|nr:hypothetical protein F2Q68_00010237 [Brassica cretica]
MESMHEELNELLEYAYNKIGWHQISIENILERLQNISNAIQKMDERWTRNDEEPKLTSNTKPDIIACLGAWYTWDRILQTSLEVPDTCLKILASCDRYSQEWLQKEVKAIQRQLASQHQISASIDRGRSKSIDRPLVASIDTTSTPDDEQLIQNKMESMHEELNELLEYAYNKIGWHQISIENILERLQNISNAIQKMDERWTRNDEEPKLTSNTKPDIIACLGAWYTWDRILQTSLEGFIHKDSNKKNSNGTWRRQSPRLASYEFLDIGQKEVNRAWWQPPLRLDSWKHVQYWSLILQYKQTLTQERN